MGFSLRDVVRDLKSRLDYYRALYAHPGTPRLSKALLWIALAYVLSPIDIIPDFIPVLGHLDDLVVVPALLALALWMVPHEVKEDCARLSSQSGTIAHQEGHTQRGDSDGE